MAAVDPTGLLEGLLPEQRDIVTTLDRPVFVAAGAGSGKTFTLTRRIVWALCPGSGEGGRPFLDSLDQALIITFTEKAAGEIKERVRGALREAGLAEEALKVDSAWVSTIHHMCARILRTNALDLGFDPEFSMIGEQQALVMRAEAAERALAELEGDPGLDALFREYGSGGRADVLALVSALRDKAASAERGLDSLEFVPARIDVEGALRALLDAYEALCACDSKYPDELEKLAASRDRLRGFFELAPGKRTGEEARRLLDTLEGPDGRKWRAKAVVDFYKEVRRLLDAARGEVSLAAAQGLEGPLMDLSRRIDGIYAEAKRSMGVLDNDDLLQLVAQAFREHPDIAARYANKFRLVMVDEFQDTNGQQVSMVKGLSGEGACHLTTVGDAQQAIYGFRGADVGVFEDRGAEVGEAGTVRLDYNFRSNDAILRFVARVCGDTGIVPAFMDLKAKQRPNGSFPERSHPRVVVELTRAHRMGKRPVPKPLRSQVAAAQLADRLARIRETGVAAHDMAVLMRSLGEADLYIRALRERGLESVVVGGSTFSRAPEVRTVLALVRALANPRDTKSGLFPVLESPMFALDANDMLLLATKPQEQLDAPAKRRIYPGARADVPDFGPVGASERLAHARRVLGRAWSRVGKLPVADVCLMALRESGWLSRLEDEGVAGRAVAANLLSAVRHVRELSEPDGLDAIRAADEFSRWLDAAKEGPASLSGEGLDAVSLMTAHASKGLEFRVVAVVGCCGSEASRPSPRLLSRREGDRVVLSLASKVISCPDLGEDTPTEPRECSSPLEWRCLMEAEHREAEGREDGRLLYVALTRARECVILALNASERSKGGLSPAMTEQVAAGLFPERPHSGEDSFDYGGAALGLVRCVDLTLQAEGVVEVDSGSTLPDCDATRACARGGAAGYSYDDAAAERTFLIPDGAADATSTDELTSWRPREGVFSYSSAHQALASGALGLGLEDVLELPQPEAPHPGETGSGVPACPVPAVEGRKAAASLPTQVPLTEDDGEAADLDDADRATSLGSAFHELARYMVETGEVPDETRMGIVTRNYGVTRRDLPRLTAALGRWGRSILRREVLSHTLVRAEVPFFLEAPSALGENLEGAIDLLACDALPSSGEVPEALLVDYKTGDQGLTLSQIRARHELQARFYAYVLKRMGYGKVTCAFVCVELEDETGEPVVMRYRF